MVVFLTSRKEDVMNDTVDFLRANHIRYNYIIWGAPYGERIIVNDKKPSGLETAIAINTPRNIAPKVHFEIDETL